MENIYIDRILSGDIEAFSYFIKTYKNMAFNIAYSIIKNEQDAEEVTQDAFIKALNGLKSFNKTATFKSWFYRIVVNESFLSIRSSKKRKTHVFIEDQNDAILEEHFDDVNNDQMDQIQETLLLLGAKESLALELFYLQELSINDIIIITGWTKANTKVILHRARKKVRQIWKEKL